MLNRLREGIKEWKERVGSMGIEKERDWMKKIWEG